MVSSAAISCTARCCRGDSPNGPEQADAASSLRNPIVRGAKLKLKEHELAIGSGGWISFTSAERAEATRLAEAQMSEPGRRLIPDRPTSRNIAAQLRGHSVSLARLAG